MTTNLTTRLTERATAFNDAGLTHSVADLLAEAARNLGTKLIQQAELAEGKKPSHVFVIPVGDADE